MKPGNNLIVNEDFSAGNTGFTSDYSFATTNTTEGEYVVGPNPPQWNPATNNCRDHTTGNGNMLLVNGNPVADEEVWVQTINVLPNANYAFSTWLQFYATWNSGNNTTAGMVPSMVSRKTQVDMFM